MIKQIMRIVGAVILLVALVGVIGGVMLWVLKTLQFTEVGYTWQTILAGFVLVNLLIPSTNDKSKEL